MKTLMLVLGLLTVIVAPRTTAARFVSVGPRFGFVASPPCAAPVYSYGFGYYHYPYPPPPPVIVYAPGPGYYYPPYPRWGWDSYDYGPRVIGYTFPGRR